MYFIPIPDRRRASPILRDSFLNAIDARDEAAITRTARELLDCIDVLPSITCTVLGLAPGSSYGDASKLIARSLPYNAQATDGAEGAYRSSRRALSTRV